MSHPLIEKPTLAKQNLWEFILFLRKGYPQGQNREALEAILTGLARNPPTEETALDHFYEDTLAVLKTIYDGMPNDLKVIEHRVISQIFTYPRCHHSFRNLANLAFEKNTRPPGKERFPISDAYSEYKGLELVVA